MRAFVKSLAYKTLMAMFLPRLQREGAVIGICHHRFEKKSGEDPIPGMAVTPKILRRQIEVLSEVGRFVSLEEALNPEPAGGIRFWLSLDDGYADNAEILPSLLGELAVPASIFVTHGFVAGEIQTLEHDRAVGHSAAAMSPEQLQALARNPLFTIGCHTFSHPRLQVFHEPDWRRECVEARHWTRQLCGTAVRDFAYPFGGIKDFDWRRGAAFLHQQGFRSISSNFGGWNSPKDPEQIGTGEHAMQHLRRIPMISSGEQDQILGWVMRMAAKGRKAWGKGVFG